MPAVCGIGGLGGVDKLAPLSPLATPPSPPSPSQVVPAVFLNPDKVTDPLPLGPGQKPQSDKLRIVIAANAIA